VPRSLPKSSNCRTAHFHIIIRAVLTYRPTIGSAHFPSETFSGGTGSPARTGQDLLYRAAQVYNWWSGGKDNAEADRRAANALTAEFRDVSIGQVVEVRPKVSSASRS
jgi:hypothetical protein